MSELGWKNVAHFLANLKLQGGDKTALVFESESGECVSHSYKEMASRAYGVAEHLKRLGVKRGERVALWLRNSDEYVIAWLGVLALGAVVVPLNACFLPAEADEILARIKARAIISEFELFSIKFKPQLIITKAEIQKIKPRASFKSEAGLADVAEIIFTSGTSGTPKGVVLTQYNLLFSVAYGADVMGLRGGESFISVMPLWHIDAQCTQLLPILGACGKFVLLSRYSASGFMASVRRHKAEITELIPKIIKTLMLSPKSELDRVHSLRLVMFYLSIGEAELIKFKSRFGVGRMLSSWGMSESVVGAITQRASESENLSSIGRLGAGYAARLVRDDGSEAGVGEAGELWLRAERGKELFSGYFDDEALNEKSFFGGWFRTGDVMRRDEWGEFYFIDRAKNLIKTLGENVSSVEIEMLISQLSGVSEVAAIGVKDELDEEMIATFIVPSGKGELSVAAVQEYCAARVARFKVPKFVIFKDNLEKTASGKVKKELLKAEFERMNLKGKANERG
ncbi:AMP-binding protein [Campylobacter sp. 19-13652]|uniref:AMP-binding protein n=1 Tax=Campylobacter sp. 19-13652 TaxID=2840180 RepID=UPI001C74DF41|nr:AMP-binding protein [Campylobacter sp. 19-13652]BCX80148.1 putative crotonobetaine/carnitine-CoA ligase [Campylobacter sp. 19-13652]